MRGIVQSKPFVKRTQRGFSSSSRPLFSHKRRGKDHSSFFSFLFKKRGAIVLIIFLSLFLIIFLLKGTRYNPAYLIQEIEYSTETRQKYENTELFVLASKFLRGKYYNTLRVGWESQLLDWVRKEYPFVRNVKLNFLWNQKVSVDFDYDEPNFLVQIGEKKFGIWKAGMAYELESSRALGQGAFLVDTPWYLSGTTSLSGFFYEVEYNRYLEYLPAIQEAFPNMTRFVYLAGSPSFVVFQDEKMIFLYRDNLLEQLQKHAWLKKYYSDYDKLTTIDLWSLTQEKVIVGQ